MMDQLGGSWRSWRPIVARLAKGVARSAILSSLMIEKIQPLKDEALAAIEAIADSDALEEVRIKYLGSKGAVKGMMAWIKDVPGDQKRDFGQLANAAQKAVTEAFEAKKSALADGASASGSKKGPQLDITEPATAPVLGRRHIISQTIDELIEVFIDELRRLSGELKEGLANNDAEMIRMASHSIKGMGGTIGLPELSVLGLEIENLAKENRLSEAAPLVDALAVWMTSFQ